MVERRRHFACEDFALLFDVAGIENPLRIGAEDAGSEMPRRDEASEQSVTIEIAGEPRDAPPPRDIAALPVGARRRIEMRGDEIAIEMHVATIVGRAEEAVERGVVRQVLRRREFEFQKRDMRLVEIDRVDARRISGEIAHDVAAAGGNRDHPALRRQLQRFHVGTRIFPDLGINHRAEGEGEGAFEKARRA